MSIELDTNTLKNTDLELEKILNERLEKGNKRSNKSRDFTNKKKKINNNDEYIINFGKKYNGVNFGDFVNDPTINKKRYTNILRKSPLKNDKVNNFIQKMETLGF